MPKNILDIKNFDGGMNSHTNSRDIEENESALIQNGIVTHKGVIKTAYKKETISSFGTISYDPPDGTALWAYKTDYDKDNNEASSEFLLSGSNRYLKRFGNGWETKIDLSSAAGASTHLFPALVTYDGQIRFCDGSLNVDSNYQPITDAKIYGVFTRKYFNGSEATIELGSNVSASITKPDNGQLSFTGSVDVTSSLRGYLGLEIKEKTSFALESISTIVGDVDYPTSLNDIYTTITTFTDDSKRSLIGSWSINPTTDVLIDEYGITRTPSNSIFGSILSTDITSEGYEVSANVANGGTYLYFTIGDDFRSKYYGENDRILQIKIGGNDHVIQNSGGATSNISWNTLFNNNVVSKVLQKYNGSTGAWETQSVDNTSYSSNNDYIKLRFTNTSDYQFRLKLTFTSVNATYSIVKLRIKDGNIFTYIQPVGSGNKYEQFRTLHTGSDDTYRIEFDNAISLTNLELGNMLTFKIAIPESSGTPTNFKIGINDSTTNVDNVLSFDLNQAFFDANRNKGWVDVQAPLSDFITFNGNPSLGNCQHLKLYLTSSSNSSIAKVFLSSFKVVKDQRGTWDGDYKFFYSWIYDRTQESSFFEFTNQGSGLTLESDRLSIQSFIRQLSTGGFSNGSTRITGANVYFAEYDNATNALKYDDPFLLLNVDFEKGISDPSLDSIQFWNTEGNHKTHSAIEFIDPPFTTNFSINSGYTYNFNDHIEKIRFRDATVMNRKIYYGNVDVLYEKREGETYPLRERYNDRVYKSLSNRPDVIPSYNYIDILVNDGDEITALESYADRLLVFKNDSMLLVNATRDVEFLEDNYQYKGVWNYAAIDKVPSGIAWANSFGAYYYDGEKIVELSDKKIDQTEWATSIGSKPTVVYEPKERHLIVANTNSDDGWVCDLDTMAWTKLVDFKDSNTTNIVFYDNNLTYGVYTSSLAFSKLVYDKTAGVNSKFSIITRDIDFGSSGTFIDFKKLYVTYKGTATNLTIQYRKNGSVSNNSLVGSFSTSLTGLSTVSFVPADKSIAKNLHSLQFVLNSAQVLLPNNIEIHDMSIVYRGKKIK